MEKYKARTGWKNFIYIEEGTDSGTTPCAPQLSAIAKEN